MSQEIIRDSDHSRYWGLLIASGIHVTAEQEAIYRAMESVMRDEDAADVPVNVPSPIQQITDRPNTRDLLLERIVRRAWERQSVMRDENEAGVPVPPLERLVQGQDVAIRVYPDVMSASESRDNMRDTLNDLGISVPEVEEMCRDVDIQERSTPELKEAFESFVPEPGRRRIRPM
jgi:phosphoribosylaminoimidazole carboxylase (NCAIR synthetase)